MGKGIRPSRMPSREGGWGAVVTSGNVEQGMMNMGVGGFADRRTIYIYICIIINIYELDDMYIPLVFPLYSGGRFGKVWFGPCSVLKSFYAR